MINVTRTYLPPFEEYTSILKRAWDKHWITNNGELVKELESELKSYFGNPNVLFCNNGTIVLQMALKALDISGEVITTPFSYVATTNVIVWEGCTPVFVDIDPKTLNIDANKIEAAITPKTQAILATHVYGTPCDVEAIEAIAKKHNLKVIYDGAHCFGARLNGKSLMDFGDVSTCSFHATKLFHTVEGGCVVVKDAALCDKLFKYRSFGHIGDEYFCVGINGKNSEFHAAMGLAVLPKIAGLIAERKELSEFYKEQLRNTHVSFPDRSEISGLEYNYAYFPVFFEDEAMLLKAMSELAKEGVFTRRYFYPSLNTLAHVPHYDPCPISEDLSVRVMALPLFNGLAKSDLERICATLQKIAPR
jgi:dTDP-4-amino-4,6-dideoxygalactose transaminase